MNRVKLAREKDAGKSDKGDINGSRTNCTSDDKANSSIITNGKESNDLGRSSKNHVIEPKRERGRPPGSKNRTRKIEEYFEVFRRGKKVHKSPTVGKVEERTATSTDADKENTDVKEGGSRISEEQIISDDKIAQQQTTGIPEEKKGSVSPALYDMVAGFMEQLNRNVTKSMLDIRNDTREIIEEECDRIVNANQNEIEEMKLEVYRREIEWAEDRRSLRASIEALKGRIEERDFSMREESMIKQWVKEELEKGTSGAGGVEDRQRGGKSFGKVERTADDREKGKSREDTEKSLKKERIIADDEVAQLETSVIPGEKREEAICPALYGMVAEFMKLVNRNVTKKMLDIRNDTREIIRKECNRTVNAIQNEIEGMKLGLHRGEIEWAEDRQSLRAGIKALEERIEERELSVREETVIKQWAKEELEKVTSATRGVADAQREEKWFRKMERIVADMEKEKSREDIEKILVSIENKMENRERQLRRPNVIIIGREFAGDDIKHEVEEFFEQELKARVGVSKATRLERRDSEKNNHGPKNVLVQMRSLEEKRRVMENKKLLRGTKIFIDDDLTKKEREIHKRIRERAKEEEEGGSLVRKGYMKLIIDGRVWKWNERKNTLGRTSFRV